MTVTASNIGAGDAIQADNAQFPDDLSVDDDSQAHHCLRRRDVEPGFISVIGLGGGATGNGTLEVDPGGGFGAEALIIGDNTSGNGVVTVNGATDFTVVTPEGIGVGDGAVTIGNLGTGDLSVTNTPAFFTESGVLGLMVGASGTLSLDSSTWGGGDLTHRRAAGTGLVTVGAGGEVALDNIVVGSAHSGHGDLTVTGADFNADFLTVGGDGTGSASFGVKSTAMFGTVTVGASADAVTLALDGSTWNSDSLTIAFAGAGASPPPARAKMSRSVTPCWVPSKTWLAT